MSSQAIDSRDLLIEAYGTVMAPAPIRQPQPGVLKVGTTITYRQQGGGAATAVVDAAQKFSRDGKLIWRYHTDDGRWVRNSDVLSIVHKEKTLDIEPTPDAARVGNASAGAATEAAEPKADTRKFYRVAVDAIYHLNANELAAAVQADICDTLSEDVWNFTEELPANDPRVIEGLDDGTVDA